MKKIVGIFLIALFASSFVAAQRVAIASTDAKIQAAIADFDGKVSIYAKNLDSGKVYSRRGEDQVRTASTIKLAIMAETFRQVAEGKVKWDDPIELTKEKKQGGSGILFEFSDGTKIDLKTAVNLMIVLSDNTATNLVLDKVTTDAVNDYMAKLGLNDTLSLRKIGGGGASKAWTNDQRNRLFGLGRT
ncbi:MAG TPA: class A beta-lactamase-related serine hydrolase, partial [Pyrinomonadaceae bacterium]|nr:class A beta-lactamase-related serine hydrolase [Pyrinomonadaceae bacterium]